MLRPCWMVLDKTHADFDTAIADCTARLKHYYPRHDLAAHVSNDGSKVLVKSVDPAYLSEQAWMAGGAVLATFETASDAQAEFAKVEWSGAREGV